MPSARRAAMKARTSCGVELGQVASASACRPDARPGSRGTGATSRCIGLDASSATSAARRRDAPASAPSRAATSVAANVNAAVAWLSIVTSCCSPSTAGSLIQRMIPRFLHPSLSGRNRPDLSAWPARSSMSWCRSRSTRPIPIGCRRDSSWRRAISSRCRSARARHRRGLGRERHDPGPASHNRLKDVERQARHTRRCKPELRKFVDWVSDYTLGAARHGAAHGLRMGEHLGPARETRRRAARRAAAAAHDAGARARARAARRRPGAQQERGRAGSRRRRPA